MAQICKNILSSQAIQTEVTEGVLYVQLVHVLRYFGTGVLYQSFTNEEWRALKKINPDPKDRIALAVHWVSGETREQGFGEDIPLPRHHFPLALSKLIKIEVNGQCQGHARFAFL